MQLEDGGVLFQTQRNLMLHSISKIAAQFNSLRWPHVAVTADELLS